MVTLVAGLAAAASFVAVAGTPTARPDRRISGLADIDDTPGWMSGLDERLLVRMRRADLARLTARPALVWAGSLLVAAMFGFVVIGPVGAAIGVVVAVLSPPATLAALGDRRLAAIDRVLPEALELVARSLRSGASVGQAVSEAAQQMDGPLGDELAGVESAVARGVPLHQALEDLAGRVPTPAMRLATAALLLGAESGGMPARAVDGVAASLRDRAAVAAEVAALSSQARASVAVIAAAPLAFMAVAVGTDPDTGRTLFRTPVGLVCLAAGLTLDAVALWWMARIVRRSA